MEGALLREVALYQFKNHQNLRVEVGNACLVLGHNGAGKSNLLESLYLFINGITPPGRTIDQCIQDEAASAFVRANILLDSGLAPEFTVSLNRDPTKIAFRIQGEVTTRQKYLQKHGLRAILFTPIEMNMLYLGPALRRDFLDEILLLSHAEFLRIRRDYMAALRSRNALLKRIAEGKNPPDDLDAWDILFVQKAKVYYTYRKKLLETIEAKLPEIAPKVRKGLQLSLRYATKVPIDETEEQIANTIKAYLHTHREKDILIGHTCIGPHLDDFSFVVETSHLRPQSSEYLSRGENKTILLFLKIMAIEYVEQHAGCRTVLLLDDIASELDANHFEYITHTFGDRTFFLSGHRLPEHFFAQEGIVTVQLS